MATAVDVDDEMVTSVLQNYYPLHGKRSRLNNVMHMRSEMESGAKKYPTTTMVEDDYLALITKRLITKIDSVCFISKVRVD